MHDTLASVEDGELVTLTGQIWSCAEMLTAPLSGTACPGYLAVARSRYGDTTGPLVDLKETKIAPFVVAVSDGSIIVEGECTIEVRPRAVSPCVPERERAFLTRRQLQHFLPSTDFAEATLCVGDWIKVSGVAVREIAGEHGYRERPERVQLISRPDRMLKLERAHPPTRASPDEDQ